MINHDQLGQLTRIGRGGQAVVYLAEKGRTSFAASIVYKEYKAATLPGVDFTALAAMSTLVENKLSEADAQRLLSMAAWPCAVVETGSNPTGFVMPAIPDRFFLTITTVKGPERAPAEFQHLLNDSDFLTARGISINDRQKLQLIHQVADALDFLHRHNIYVGDISPKNLLFSLSPQPAVYFVDCDTMCINGESALQQVETPGWEVPAGEEVGTPASDTYKLGLLATRLLAGNQDTTSTHLSPHIPAALRRIITETLERPPQKRPVPAAWVYILEGLLDEDTQPDRAPRASAQRKPADRPLQPAKPPPPPKLRSRPPVSNAPTPPPAKQAIRPPTQAPMRALLWANGPAPSATGSALSDVQKALYVGAAILLLAIIGSIIAVANQSDNTYTSSRSTSSSKTYWTSTTTTPPVPEDPTTRIIRTAPVGSCIHRNMGKTRNADGSYSVDVTSAECGTFYATDRITLRTNDINDCGRSAWVRNRGSPPVVLCLAPD